MRLPSGLYEQLINLAMSEGLREIEAQGERLVVSEPLDKGEAQPILAQYLYEVLGRGLRYLRDKFREGQYLNQQVEACNRLIELMADITDEEELLEWRIGDEQRQLLAILETRNTPMTVGRARKTEVLRPQTPLSLSTLFTGSSQEPSMVSELKKEILTADRIDMLVSFIKWSGLRLIMDVLREFTKTRKLRIITTSYLGATDLKAMLELARLPNTEIKVSYDNRTTRLHAKSYMFYRETGFSTVYIGSSNLSSAALGSGLEWNVKVTEKDMPHILRNVEATFETYWNDDDFQSFLKEDEAELQHALQAERQSDNDDDKAYFFDIKPYPFQEEILDKLEAERKLHGRYRNLVVAATGTGKTVISAFDYLRFRQANPDKPNRLLFVAHRQEILKQSLKCFRSILRDNNFGELFFGGTSPRSVDHLFISIQTFNAQEFYTTTSPDYYDFIIVDEFHHAAAPSYQALLDYYQPYILLGLTATPERMDGLDICADYFGGIMAAEIRLPEAINRQLLAPFQYFGVTDEVDISQVRFERGRYDVNELENVYTGNDMRTDAILRAVRKYVTDVRQVIGLGFCVSVEHAKYMARRFTEKGIPSLALHGESSSEERASAQRMLVNHKVHFIFTVDLYNEGVDIPEVNTVLFLRPTESLTVFLQQLGRGLRLSPGKDVLTVLDFINKGNHRYDFEWKFRALMNRTRRSVQKELEEGFSALPRGCYIQLEKVAQETVLENIKGTIVNRRYLENRLRNFSLDTGEAVSLASFLRTYPSVSPQDIYRFGTFSRLCANANVRDNYVSPYEASLQKAFLRISYVDSRRWINFMLQALQGDLPAQLGEEEDRMLRMFYYVIWQKLPSQLGIKNAREGIELLTNETVLCEELTALLTWRYNHIDFIDEHVDVGFPCPLDLHCTYSRDAILAAVGAWTDEERPEMREGVKYLSEQNTDIFLINLHKTEKDFSPTTMYEDYAISPTLFHWQSQSTTSADSPTGQRYIHHGNRGGQVLLFVREYKDIRGVTQPYIYLGKAHYLRHTGSRPMSIIWRLEKPMPPHLLSKAIQAGVV